MKINNVEVDRDKFIGRILVRRDGKVQVVTVLSGGDESTRWATWEEIKRAVEQVLRDMVADGEGK